MTGGAPMGALEIVRLSHATTEGLLELLQAIEKEGESRWFEPHPFTREHLHSLCEPRKLDLYYVAAVGNTVLAYGLLRGWDEGYEVPSLGIAVRPGCRGMGLGPVMMEFLHGAARLRGSERVRLRVSDDNRVAIALYRRMGYRFEELDEQIVSGRPVVGFKELKNAGAATPAGVN